MKDHPTHEQLVLYWMRDKALPLVERREIGEHIIDGCEKCFKVLSAFESLAAAFEPN